MLAPFTTHILFDKPKGDGKRRNETAQVDEGTKWFRPFMSERSLSARAKAKKKRNGKRKYIPSSS